MMTLKAHDGTLAGRFDSMLDGFGVYNHLEDDEISAVIDEIEVAILQQKHYQQAIADVKLLRGALEKAKELRKHIIPISSDGAILRYQEFIDVLNEALAATDRPEYKEVVG